MQEYDLKIDPEFESLHIKASEKHTEKLENSLLENGLAHPLLIWHGVIVDGHKRYRICQKRYMPYKVRHMAFGSRHDVMLWICDQMLLRNDLSEERKKYYIGKKFLFQYDAMLYKPYGINASDYKSPIGCRYKMAEKIGAGFSLSSSAVLKYSQYASALDSIRGQDPMIFERIISGEVKVSHKNILDISNLSGDDMRFLHSCFKEKNRTHITHSEIWHELSWNRVHPTLPTSRKKPVVTAPIKQMPAYDPDAEISSLSLTIPSWISSIERTVSNADFSSATDSAKNKLREQLNALRKAAEFLYSYTQEASNECN